MVIQRGEIWWASLPEPVGSEPGFSRPVLVVQSDDFNRSAIRTIVALTISSNLRLADAPGNVFLPRNRSKLKKDSVVNVSQVITLDKSFLSGRVCRLPPSLLDEVDDGLRLSLFL